MVDSRAILAKISRRKSRKGEQLYAFESRKLDKMSSATMLSFFRCCSSDKTFARLLSGAFWRYCSTTFDASVDEGSAAAKAAASSFKNTMIIDEEFVRNCKKVSSVRLRER